MKKAEENTLVCKNVKFFSKNGEDAFFNWVKQIDCIDRMSVVDNQVYLYVCADDIHDYDLRDLLALFYRYKIDMKQLKVFLTEDNKEWFYDNKKAFWHKAVFGE